MPKYRNCKVTIMQTKRRRTIIQSIFATMAGFALLASQDVSAATANDDWGGDMKPLPLDGKDASSLKGVTVTLQETQVLKDGLVQYTSDGKPVVEYKILSQEPSRRSKTIIKHMDGTTEVLDEETIREVRATGSSSGSHFGVVDFLVMRSMMGMMFGNTSYTPNPAYFASNDAYARSRNMAPAMVAGFNASRDKEKDRRQGGGSGAFVRGYYGGAHSSGIASKSAPLTRQSLFAKASVSRGTAVPSSGRSGFFSGSRGSMGA